MFRSVVIKTEKKKINPGHLTVAGEAIEISVVVILFTLDIKFADRHIRKIKGTREKANGFVAVHLQLPGSSRVRINIHNIMRRRADLE